MAPEAIYKQMGLEWTFYADPLRFTLNEDRSISIRTRDPIHEPFMNFVIQITWPEGEIVREYRLLFDPI